MEMNEVKLESDRLILRWFREGDLADLCRMTADPEVMKFLGDGQPPDEMNTWRQMATYMGHWHYRGYGIWAGEEKSSRRGVGRIGFMHPVGSHRAARRPAREPPESQTTGRPGRGTAMAPVTGDWDRLCSGGCNVTAPDPCYDARPCYRRPRWRQRDATNTFAGSASGADPVVPQEEDADPPVDTPPAGALHSRRPGRSSEPV